MPANAALFQFAAAYALAGVILATIVALFLCLFKSVPASRERRVRGLGIAVLVELIATGLLMAAGAIRFGPDTTRETLEKPLRDENAALRQESQQAEAAAAQGEAERQAFQQQVRAAQQALAKDDQEKQRLLQQTQNLGKDITASVVASEQTRTLELQQQLQAAQARVDQLKEVNAALNDELAAHAVHHGPARLVPTPVPDMTPLTH